MKTKAKTKKIVAKRFRITKTGKILRRRQNSRHLKASKSKKQKNRMKKLTEVKGAHKRMIKKLLPYG